MSTALEDQLAEARTQIERLRTENHEGAGQLTEARNRITELERDQQAQADLLSESSAKVDSLGGQVELLTAEIDTLKSERDTARGEASTLQKQVTDLQASQADFDGRVQTEVARVVASTGTTAPARVTPAGDQEQASDLHARFAAITDPAEQTAFWRKLTPDQQALILKHQG